MSHAHECAQINQIKALNKHMHFHVEHTQMPIFQHRSKEEKQSEKRIVIIMTKDQHQFEFNIQRTKAVQTEHKILSGNTAAPP